VNEQRYTLGVVYKADTPDAHGEFMTREELRKAAWDYAVNAREVGVFHADGTGGTGVPVESFLWPDGAPDWEVKAADGSTVVVVKSGDWLMGNVWSPGAWRLIKSGRINGLSMQGLAVRREAPATVTKSRRPPVPTKQTKATGVPVQLVKAKIDRVDGVNGPANEVPFLVMKAAVLPGDEDETEQLGDETADDGVTVEVESADAAGDEPEAAEVEPGETPGDAAWEKQDAAAAEKAATLLAGLKSQVDALIEREMAEDPEADVSMLQMACSDLDWVLGVIAKFSFTEQADSDAAKTEPPAEDEAAEGSATDEEEATVTKSATMDEVTALVEGKFSEVMKAVEALKPSAPTDDETSTEQAATAAEPVVKQSDTDVSEVLKSTLPWALEPITKAMEAVATVLANVSERLEAVEAQDAKAGPLLKGAHVQAAQSHLWGERPSGDPYAAHLPGGIDSREQLTKAVAAISDPRARDEAGRELAVAMHPLFSNTQ
jgi:hypothetical protein